MTMTFATIEALIRFLSANDLRLQIVSLEEFLLDKEVFIWLREIPEAGVYKNMLGEWEIYIPLSAFMQGVWISGKKSRQERERNTDEYLLDKWNGLKNKLTTSVRSLISSKVYS